MLSFAQSVSEDRPRVSVGSAGAESDETVGLERDSATALDPSLWRGLSIAVWFGILAGLVEGVGLFFSPAINWYRETQMGRAHV